MDELTVQKTRCNCHPETCGHWPYSLMLGSERITTGEKEECERLLALLTSRNTRAASGGDSASLEKRARGALSGLIHSMADIVNVAQTDAQFDADVLPRSPVMDAVAKMRQHWDELSKFITAALANQQGVGGQVGTFFAADPALGEFNNHPTLDAARADARKMLDYASDDAADSGWADDPPQICYGVVLGHCVEVMDSRRPAPEGSDFTELVEFELAATQPAGDVGREG